MIHGLREAYETLPPLLHGAVGAAGRHLPVRLRYGRRFVEMASDIHSAEWLSRDEQEARSRDRLAWVVESARTAPYWKRTFEEADVPAGPCNYEELSKLPLLDKQTVRMSHEAMVSASCPESSRKWVSTGGTTGVPLGLWIDKDASVADWAFVISAWSRVGFRLDERRVVLRGRRLGDKEYREVFEYEPIRRELYVSTFDLDAGHLPSIAERMNRFGARFIHGYPSAMEVVGRYYNEAGVRPPCTKALLAVSENLYPGQRETLEELFDSRVFSFYGMTEKGAFAAECECSTELHVEPLYGIVEIVDEGGRRVDAPGVQGEIVVTSLMSKSMPLFRYRTGDYSSWAEGACPCGRAHRRLRSIHGRWTQEYLVTRGGAKISMTSLNVHSPVFAPVRRFRFVQSVPGVVTLLIQPGASYTQADSGRIITELNGKLSGQVDLHVELVDSIPLTAIGKHRFIDQQLEVQ